MTGALQRAFAAAAQLSAEEQDDLAERLLAELGVDDEFDRAIACSGDRLAPLAADALAEHRAGLTQPLDTERP